MTLRCLGKRLCPATSCAQTGAATPVGAMRSSAGSVPCRLAPGPSLIHRRSISQVMRSELGHSGSAGHPAPSPSPMGASSTTNLASSTPTHEGGSAMKGASIKGSATVASATPHALAASAPTPGHLQAPHATATTPTLAQQHMYSSDADDQQPGAPSMQPGTWYRSQRAHNHMPPRHRPDATAEEEARLMDAAQSATAWASFDGEAHKASAGSSSGSSASSRLARFDPAVRREDAFFSFDGTSDSATRGMSPAFDQFEQQPKPHTPDLTDMDDRPFLRRHPDKTAHKAALIASLAAQAAAAAAAGDAGTDSDTVGAVSSSSPPGATAHTSHPQPHKPHGHFTEKLQAALQSHSSLSSGGSEDLHL